MEVPSNPGKCPECLKDCLTSKLKLHRSKTQEYCGDRHCRADEFCDEGGYYHSHGHLEKINYNWECDNGHTGTAIRIESKCPHKDCTENRNMVTIVCAEDK
jgi:hypothetical protein